MVAKALILLAEFAQRFVNAHPGTWLALAISALAAILFVLAIIFESVFWLWGVIGFAEVILALSMAQEAAVCGHPPAAACSPVFPTLVVTAAD